MIKGLETKLYKEWLMHMFRLEKRRLRNGIIAIFKHLNGCHMEDGASLFSAALGDLNYKKGDFV